MPEQYKVVTTKGYGKRLMESFGGMAMGVLLFFASFGVLYWNEGRVDVSTVAVNAVEISADEVDTAADGKQVYVYGAVTAEQDLGDGLFLNPKDYLAIQRNVEMYAWTETSKSESDSNLGGSETTETTYTYQTEWISTVPDSSSFYIPTGHTNPAKPYESEEFRVSEVKVGVYDLDFEKIELPNFEKLTVNQDTVTLSGNAIIKDAYVYIPAGTLAPGSSAVTGGTITGTTPQVGDARISYSVIKNGTEGTVFGKLKGEKIEAYVDLDDTGAKVYRFCDSSRDECIAQMHSEYKMMLWIFRAVGFFMMWIGLSMLLGPISTFLDVVPFFGSLSRGLIGVVTLIVALVLSIVTILISMIIHNIVALIATLVVLIGIFLWFWKKKGTRPTVVKV